MPEIDSGARFRKWVTVLVGIAAATAGVLAFAEAEACLLYTSDAADE